MKTILSIILALTCASPAQEAATGDYVFRKKAARGYESVTLTPEANKVIGWTNGNLANVVGGGGGSSTYAALTDAATVNLPTVNTPLLTALGLKAPLASPTFAGTVNAATITASGNITGANLSGTNTGDNATNSQYSGLAASKANVANPTFTGSASFEDIASTTGIEAPQVMSDGFYGPINRANFAGPTVDRVFTLPDSAATLLYSGGPLGTPASGVGTNLTGLPLTTGVSGVLPVANGGTGVSTAKVAFVRTTSATTTNTNTGLIDITGLSMTISETGTYKLTSFVSATPANSSMGVKVAHIFSAATGTQAGITRWTNNALVSAMTPYANIALNTSAETRQIAGGVNGQPAQMNQEMILVITTAPVTLKYQFAQHTSNASNLTADIGNWMMLEKLP